MPSFDPTKSKLVYQLTFGGSWPKAVAFLGDGQRLAAGNQFGQIYVWNLPAAPPAGAKPGGKDRMAPNLPPVRRLEGHVNEISQLAATPDGKLLISTSYDHSVRVWRTDGPAAGKAEAFLDGSTRQKAPGKQAAKTPEPSEGVMVETQTASDILAGHANWIFALGLSADGTRAITGDTSSNVIVWDIPGRKPIAKWAGYPWAWIVSASLAPDGQTALVSEYAYKRDDFDIPPPALKLWDVATATEKLDILKVQFPKLDPKIRTYGSSQAWRKFVADGLITTAFSPDGKLIAAGQGGETDTGKVHLFDAANGKLVRTISGHRYGVTSLLFSSDGKHLISGGRDTQVRICQVADGKEVAVLNTPRGGQFKDWLSALAISPDQKRLAAADIAGIVHVWEFA